MRNSRRGSMQLGIETVVILIIAIVLLGSMIYFIKSLISPDDLQAQIGNERGCGKTIIPNDATPILPKQYTVNQGGRSDLELCVYNNYGKTVTDARVHFLSCLKPDLTEVPSPETYFKVASLGEEFPRGESKPYQLKLETTAAVTENELGTWVCRVQVSRDKAAITDTNPGVGPIQLTFEME